MKDWDDYLDPSLDQTSKGPTRRLFICSAPRAGSHLLCRVLLECGVGVPFEYFHPAFQERLMNRFGCRTLQDYTKTVLTQRSRNGVFTAKFEWGWMERVQTVEAELFQQPCSWIFLMRQSALDQAISFYIAQLNGVFGPTLSERPSETEPTAEGLARCIKIICNNEAKWRRFFARKGIEPMFITYENLVGDTAQIIKSVAQSVDIEINSQMLIDSLKSEHRYRKPEGLEDRIRRLLPLAQELFG